MILEGPHVKVRPVTEADLPALHRFWNDPVVMREVRAEGFSVTLEALRNKYWPLWASSRPDKYHELIIEHEGRPIGEIGYQVEQEQPRVASVDIKIGEPALWGRRLGSEAMGLLLAYLFDEVGVERVVGQPGAWNERSLRLLARAGFIEVRREELPATAVHQGGTMVTMELTRRRFDEGRRRHGR